MNELPIFLWYDTERIENDASNNSSLPQERLYRTTYLATVGGSTDPPLIKHEPHW
jgi:hypothetical protein